MKKSLKKALAVLLCLVMLFTVMSTGVSALVIEDVWEMLPFDTYISIGLDEENPAGEFKFVPNESGTYCFYTDAGNHITWGKVYDSKGEVISSAEGTESNGGITISIDLVAEEEYYFEVGADTDYANFGIGVTDVAVRSIEAQPYAAMECQGGYWQTETLTDGTEREYYYYTEWSWNANYKVTMTDGTVIDVTGNHFNYNDKEFGIYSVDEQSYDSQWTAGNTYNVNVSTIGATCSLPVTVNESIVESFTIQPIHMYEGTDGDFCLSTNEDGNEQEYYEYRWYNFINYTIKLKNGGEITGEGTHFSVDGCDYFINYENPQGPGKEFKGGETYTLKAELVGKRCDVKVTIEKSPIESISFGKVSFIKENNGYFESVYLENGEEAEFYRYSLNKNVDYTITFNDGTTQTGCDTGFYYNDKWYNFEYKDVQSYENQWTSGNTYSVTYYAMGVPGNVNVEIINTPIESIVFEPSEFIEGTNGYYTTDWDFENNMPTEEYFYYHSHADLKYTIKFFDGTVIEGSDWNVLYNDTYYSFISVDNQNYENRWTAGNTYDVEYTLLGYTTVAKVSIIESPIESITMKPLEFIEGTSGSMTSYYDEETGEIVEYYEYNFADYLEFTLNFKDGSSAKGTGTGYYDEKYNIWYNLECPNTQHIEPWTVGNTYEIQVKCLGVESTLKVTIAESPIESIVFENIVYSEQDGEYCSYYDYETDTYYDFYRYYWGDRLSYTATLKDGTVITDCGYGITLGDRYFDFYYSDHQDYEDRYILGNTYTEEIEVLGYTATVDITISDTFEYDGYQYLIDGENAYITGYIGDESSLDIPKEIDGYTVKGILGLSSYIEEVTIPDSVTQLGNEWIFDGESLVTVNIGSSIKTIPTMYIEWATNLQAINISEENPYLASIDGIVYDKDYTRIIAIPKAKTGKHKVPDTVTDIEVYIYGSYNISLDLGNSKTGYVMEDGILYNEEKSTIFACDSSKTGSYTMPDSVINIIEGAFENSQLSEVKVSNNVAYIAYAAFYGSAISKITLPEKLEAIGGFAFAECDSLETVELPEGLVEIQEGAFMDSGITSAHIPASLKYIGNGAYKYSDIETVTFEEGIDNIGYSVFADTMNLKNVVLPDSLTYLGEYAFEYSSIESITFGKGLTEISYECFYESGLKSVKLPENIIYVGTRAFYGCSNLALVEFENDEISIGEAAFTNCAIEELNIKDGVEYIGDYAFAGNRLESLNLPETVTSITYRSFEYNENLSEINVSDNLNSLCGYAFEGTAWYNNQPDGDIYLENYYYGYKGEMPENSEIVIKEGTTIIADWAFSALKDVNLKSITLPASLEHIGFRAFASSLKLEEIKIAEGNEKFVYENGVLKDKDSNVYWAKPERISHADIISEFDVGDDFYVDWYDYIEIECAEGNYIHFSGYDEIMNELKVSGYDKYKEGEQTVTLEFFGMTYEHTVTVNFVPLECIEIDVCPETVVYNLNQNLRTAGLMVSACTVDGYWYEVTDFEISGYDATKVGEQEITVSYKGFTDTFTVEVIDEKEVFNSETTEEKIEVIADKGTFEAGTQLIVEKQEVEEIKEEIVIPEDAIEEKTVIFDISFEKDGEEVQPKESVTVAIPVPAHLDGLRCKVYWFTADGCEEIPSVYVDGYLEFTAEHFSYYGISQVSGVSFSGQITDYEGDGLISNVFLVKGNSLVAQTITLDGSYSFSDVLEGEYTLYAYSPGYAQGETPITVDKEGTAHDLTLYLLGDITKDGLINTGDLAEMKLYLAGVNEDAYEPAVDMNDDGVYDVGDLAEMKLYLAGY